MSSLSPSDQADSTRDFNLDPIAASQLAARPGRRLADLAVLVVGADTDEPAIAFAETVAEAFGAHLDVFLANHVGLPPMLAAPGAAELEFQLIAQGRRNGDNAQERLRERLGRLAVPWELRREDGTFGDLLPHVVSQALTCDLVVMPQKSAIFSGGRELLDAVLFAAGSGALVVPPPPVGGFKSPATVLVGWRDTPECAHAVSFALPFLERADSVILATVAEEGASEQRRREPMADTARHLARHGVTVETRELPNWRRPSEGLLHEAESIGAEMVVIGAYGHSRMRERLLGGVTRELLRTARVPLLLAH